MLGDVITALQNAIQADPRCPVGITFDFGEVGAQHHGSPPRIVWIPMPSQITGSEHGGYNPRTAFTREVAVQAHCWGFDTTAGATQMAHYAAAEQLVQLLLCALYTEVEGIVTPSTEDPLQPDNLPRGWLFRVDFTVKIPAVLPTDAVVNPTSDTTAFPP